ncbi:MAG TPA: VCBS repeat-containing protein [Polyangiaceae bacterium]|nr:VCBS repeat-containing protein [Polyangiaceae bacterium]
MKARGLVAACAALVTLAGCTTFPVIQKNECGNAVIEDGETCDTYGDPHTKGSICRPKGVPGEECHFDCRVNAAGVRGVCPTRMGCAADGVCRSPTGDFQLPASKFSSEASSWVSSADFDGDGRAEVISTEPPDQLQEGRFRLHYFDADTKLLETRTFPRITTRPIVGQLNGDQLSDIVFSNLRIGMVPGRKDREWIPATFSSYTVPNSELRVLTVSEVEVGRALALLAFATLEDVSGIYVPSANTGKLALLQELSRPLQTLAGPPLAADIVVGADSPCLEVAFAFRGADSLELLDPCTIGASLDVSQLVWRDSPEAQVVPLPPGSQIDAGPISADVDGDGHLDILIGADGHTYVAHGDGQRLEDTAALLTIPVIGRSRGEEPVIVQLDGPLPLAAGDITGDGVADYVTPAGVIGSRRSLVDSSVAYFSSYDNSAQLWSTALVLDLNGNGLPDVIAASEGAPGLSFLSGTGGPFPVPARINSQGPVKLIGTGDFDGDQITDIAFMEGGPPRSANDSLAVAYGNRDRVPLDPIRIAELPGVQQLGGMRDAAIDDIFTASTLQADGGPRSTFTLFGGDADRLPFAPYTLVNFAVDGSLLDWAAPALMVGAFTAHGAHDVVAMGTHDYTKLWNQWLIPDVGGGQAPPRLLDGDPPPGLLPYTTDRGGVRLSVASVATDLDGDGLDEALWLMPRHPNDVSSPCTLLIYDIDAEASRTELKQRLDFDEPCATPELVAAPLSADAELQLLVLLGDPAQGPRQLEILWNDHHGNFSVDDHSYVHDRNNDDVRAFSVFPPRWGTGLAFVTETALHIASPHRDGREFDEVSDIDASFDDARGVAVADPNGDGIDDVVVADAAGLWLLQAELR